MPNKSHIYIPNYRFSAFFGNVHQKVTWPRRRDNFRFVTVHSCCTYIIPHPEQNDSGKNLAKKLSLDQIPQNVYTYFFMKNRTAIKEYIYDNELKLLQLFINLFHSTDTEDVFLNSTKLRHIINNSDTPCISLKTFDEGIHLLNKNFLRVPAKIPFSKIMLNFQESAFTYRCILSASTALFMF